MRRVAAICALLVAGCATDGGNYDPVAGAAMLGMGVQMMTQPTGYIPPPTPNFGVTNCTATSWGMSCNSY